MTKQINTILQNRWHRPSSRSDTLAQQNSNKTIQIIRTATGKMWKNSQIACSDRWTESGKSINNRTPHYNCIRANIRLHCFTNEEEEGKERNGRTRAPNTNGFQCGTLKKAQKRSQTQMSNSKQQQKNALRTRNGQDEKEMAH